MIGFRVWVMEEPYDSIPREPFKDGQQAKNKEEFLERIVRTFSELWDKKIIEDGKLYDLDIYK